MSKWDKFKKPILTDAEAEELYDMAVENEYHGRDHGIKRISSFLPYIRKHLKKGGAVLEVGCGQGGVARILKKQFGFKVLATDLSLKTLNKFCGDLETMQLSMSQLHKIEDNTYDMVVAIDVLEHLCTEDAGKQAISDFARITKNCAVLSIAFTPSHAFRDKVQLHKLIRPKDWWTKIIKSHFEILFQEGKKYFCKVKKNAK